MKTVRVATRDVEITKTAAMRIARTVRSVAPKDGRMRASMALIAASVYSTVAAVLEIAAA